VNDAAIDQSAHAINVTLSDLQEFEKACIKYGIAQGRYGVESDQAWDLQIALDEIRARLRGEPVPDSVLAYNSEI
jgi:hypothetical protein